MTENRTDKYIFETEFDVRDYELDAEGIVNNANYLHYLEHTRHLFCHQHGFSFSHMRSRGIDPVLNRVEADYLTPLRSGDSVRSCLGMERKGPRFIFTQHLFRLPDMTPVMRAKVSVVALRDGRLTRGDELAEAFAKFL